EQLVVARGDHGPGLPLRPAQGERLDQAEVEAVADARHPLPDAVAVVGQQDRPGDLRVEQLPVLQRHLQPQPTGVPTEDVVVGDLEVDGRGVEDVSNEAVGEVKFTTFAMYSHM